MATGIFFLELSNFQKKREEVEREYFARKEQLKTAIGSQMYDDGMEEARKQRDEKIEKLQKECRKEVARITQQMRENVRNRKLTPPTQEQLAILEALKMRDSVTVSELEHAAMSMDGNPLCISVLADISHKQGFPNSFSRWSKEYLEGEALKTIDQLENGANMVIESPIRHGALAAAKFNRDHNGVDFDPDDLPREKPFEYTENCIQALGFPFGASWDQVKAFCDAVDG